MSAPLLRIFFSQAAFPYSVLLFLPIFTLGGDSSRRFQLSPHRRRLVGFPVSSTCTLCLNRRLQSQKPPPIGHSPPPLSSRLLGISSRLLILYKFLFLEAALFPALLHFRHLMGDSFYLSVEKPLQQEWFHLLL